MGLAYRLKQFWRLIQVEPLTDNAWTTIEEILSPEEVALFRRQTAADRAHSFRVLQTLQESGEDHPSLLRAALLHDVGKSRVETSIVDRVVGAVGEKLFPGKATAWGEVVDSRWRRPFVIRKKHAEWGAALARQAGSDPLTVRLIRRHQDSPELLEDSELRRLLQRLQRADNQN